MVPISMHLRQALLHGVHTKPTGLLRFGRQEHVQADAPRCRCVVMRQLYRAFVVCAAVNVGGVGI